MIANFYLVTELPTLLLFDAEAKLISRHGQQWVENDPKATKLYWSTGAALAIEPVPKFAANDDGLYDPSKDTGLENPPHTVAKPVVVLKTTPMVVIKTPPGGTQNSFSGGVLKIPL